MGDGVRHSRKLSRNSSATMSNLMQTQGDALLLRRKTTSSKFRPARIGRPLWALNFSFFEVSTASSSCVLVWALKSRVILCSVMHWVEAQSRPVDRLQFHAYQSCWRPAPRFLTRMENTLAATLGPSVARQLQSSWNTCLAACPSSCKVCFEKGSSLQRFPQSTSSLGSRYNACTCCSSSFHGHLHSTRESIHHQSDVDAVQESLSHGRRTRSHTVLRPSRPLSPRTVVSIVAVILRNAERKPVHHGRTCH